MKGKYTHKFIIYHNKNIQSNFLGLVEKLAVLEDSILLDFFEQLVEESDIFEKLRWEFYYKNGFDYEEILAIDEEVNIKTNKVLAFVQKHPEFGELIAGIDYFDGENEYIERFIPQRNHIGDGKLCFYFVHNDFAMVRFVLDYIYRFENDNQLNIFLKEIMQYDLLQG